MTYLAASDHMAEWLSKLEPQMRSALLVLQQVTQDEGANFPLAVPVVRQNTYIDDCVFGADVPLALQTRNQFISILNRADFKLRKWTSNNPFWDRSSESQSRATKASST